MTPALELPRVAWSSQLRLARRAASARVDVLLFSAVAAIVALHATVDSFIAPEPGTGPVDHLLRGLDVTRPARPRSAIYPRLAIGGRAAVAAVLGVLALEGAALRSRTPAPSAREARTGPASCSFLRPAAVGLAVVLLWRSRKPGRLRYLRRAGIALQRSRGVRLVVPVAIGILATHRPRAAVEPADLGRPYEEVTLRTSDGLDLAAWYVPRATAPPSSRTRPARGSCAQARMLVRHGYGVLLVDARGYDGSDGDPNLFGWGDAKDIDAAVAWLQQRPDVNAVGSAASASRWAAR